MAEPSVANRQQTARKAISEKETFGLENGAKIHHIPGPKKNVQAQL